MTQGTILENNEGNRSLPVLTGGSYCHGTSRVKGNQGNPKTGKETVDKAGRPPYNEQAFCESAGIGRQARLRGVCRMACGFKSHLSHQKALSQNSN